MKYAKQAICVSPFGYQAIEKVNPKKLELPLESHTGIRKDLDLGSSRKRNSSPGERFAICQTMLQERMELKPW